MSEVLSLMDDLFSGLGSSCIVAGKRTGDRPHSVMYSVVFKCLEPDSLYKLELAVARPFTYLWLQDPPSLPECPPLIFIVVPCGLVGC
ncbi:Astrotactin-2 Precursor [Takifugu flavidus]|uniref:Astrotactin-2 n=1 Tax=Takifugu flavidus TaxID=433684 RepID=A0A5C6NJ58_9TELE|nr:Astrotactin-2 Precursor [Takifugu flavidus]